MNPYYADDAVTLYHGDALEVLPRLPRASVDLIVADPPYGVAWQSGLRKTKLKKIHGDDGSVDVAALLALALALLRHKRHVYVFGRTDLTSLPLVSPVELIWDKQHQGPGDLALPWGPAHEPIMFAVYDAHPSCVAQGSGALAARLRRGSVLRCPRLNGNSLNDKNVRHPTEKPVELLRQLIESSSVIGETVLDPFAGSGSTLVAARLEGRRAIGVEIDERYCEVIAKRLAQDVLPFGELAS